MTDLVAQQVEDVVIKPTVSLSTESSTSTNALSDDSNPASAAMNDHPKAGVKVKSEVNNVALQAPTPPPTPLTTGRWSSEEQDQFIALFLPHINGKSLSEEEISTIRAEARSANLPDSCVDRLLEENYKVYLEKKKLKQEERRKRRKDRKHKRRKSREEYENMEDVDESDNILAYFSRMASLKQGGHFPGLNTDACESFVDTAVDDDHVEVDLDVGYVNKSLDTSFEATYIQDQTSSWEDNGFHDGQDDVRSTGSSTIEGRKRSDPIRSGDRPMSPFDALLIGGASTPSRHVTWDTTLSTDDNEAANPPAVETLLEAKAATVLEKSLVLSEKMEDAILRSRDEATEDGVLSSFTATAPYCYGYKKDLDEWTRKKNIAEWQPNPKNKQSLLASFSCETHAKDVVSEELNGGSGMSMEIPAPSLLRGMTAVKRLMAKADERRQQRLEMKERRRVPEKTVYSSKVWQLPYRERCFGNPGYVGVDLYSMAETTAAVPLQFLSPDARDRSPWELREVKQHFLYEHSAVERNWFGKCNNS